jgi:hypothetical protein
MSTLTNAYVPAAQAPSHPLTTIALFCGLVLGLYACMASYGLDLSPGFF